MMSQPSPLLVLPSLLFGVAVFLPAGPAGHEFADRRDVRFRRCCYHSNNFPAEKLAMCNYTSLFASEGIEKPQLACDALLQYRIAGGTTASWLNANQSANTDTNESEESGKVDVDPNWFGKRRRRRKRRDSAFPNQASRDYLWCMADGHDNTKCCAKANVTKSCLHLCKGDTDLAQLDAAVPSECEGQMLRQVFSCHFRHSSNITTPRSTPKPN